MLGGTFLGEPFLGEGQITLSFVTPTGIAPTVAFGDPTLTAFSAATIHPTGIAPTVAFGVPVLTTQVVRPTGIAPTVAFGAPAVTQTPPVSPFIIAVAGIPPKGTYTNQAGAAYTNQAGADYTIQRFPTIGVPVVSRVRTLAVTGIAPTVGFGAPTVRAKNRIACTGIAPTVAFGDPTLAQAAALIAPAGIASTVTFGTPTLVPSTGARGTYSEGTYGSGTYAGAFAQAVVVPAGIAPTVRFGAVRVFHTGILTGHHWHTKVPRPRWSVGFPHGRWHAWDATPPDANVTYTMVRALVRPARHRLHPVGIAPTVAFGTPVFPTPDQTVTLAAIDPTVTFGEPALALGALATIAVAGISPTVALGTVQVGADTSAAPVGIAPTVRFGVPTVARPPRRTITVTGIASTLVLGPGTLAKRPNRKTIALTGIAPTAQLGVPAVTRGGITPPPPPPGTLQEQINATPTGGTLDIGSQQFIVTTTFGLVKPMRITGNPDAYIKLQTNNSIDAGARNMPVLDIRANNFTIDGFQIIGDSPSNISFVITKEARHAIQVTGTDNTTIRNMSLHNTYGDGIAAVKHISSTGVQEDCVNLAIEDCVLDQIGRVGVTLDNVKGGHMTGSAPNKMVIRRHNNSAIDIEPPGSNDGCTDFTIDNVDVYYNVGAGFTVSSAGLGGPKWIPGQPAPDPSTYTIRNIHISNVRSHGAAFTVTIVPPAFKAAYTDANGVFHPATYMVRRGPFFVTDCSGDTPFNNATEPYRFHRCDGVTIVNSNQTLGQNAKAMVQFDDCTNATITPPASTTP